MENVAVPWHVLPQLGEQPESLHEPMQWTGEQQSSPVTVAPGRVSPCLASHGLPYAFAYWLMENVAVPWHVLPQPGEQPESLHEPTQWIGHVAVLHGVSELMGEPPSSFEQSLPPCSGAGLVHQRLLVRVPVWPQAPLTEHVSRAPQLDQPPLMGVITQMLFSIW
jgi:hypothetical protein